MSTDARTESETEHSHTKTNHYHFRRNRHRMNSAYMRNLIFGAEDSLVSTVGFLFGLASSNQYSSQQIVLAGIVLIAVEALSMGVGSYLSESEIHKIEPNVHADKPIFDGIIMFSSYLLAGIITILPYAFLEPGIARLVSMGIALILLFFIGYLPLKDKKMGLKMLVLTSGAILVGYIVALIFDES